MSKKFAALSALAGVMATGAAMPAANAGIVVPEQNQGFGVGTEPGVQFAGEGREGFMDMGSTTSTLTFDLFDPAAGTLTGVRIAVDFGGINSVASSSELTQEPNIDDGVTATSTAFLTFGTSGEQFLQFSSDVSDSCTPLPGDTECSFESSQEFDGSDEQTNFNLNEFIGVGTFDLDVELKVTVEGEVTGFYTGSANAFSFVEGGIDVRYEYIPDGVRISEPTSLALLGLGLGGFGVMRRKRRNA